MKKKEFLKILDNKGLDRMRVSLKTDKSELVDIVFQYEAFINEAWHPIVRYDCHHGFFHRDVLIPNGIKEKYELVIDNLKMAATYAEQDIKDRWEWYKERYIKKLKK